MLLKLTRWTWITKAIKRAQLKPGLFGMIGLFLLAAVMGPTLVRAATFDVFLEGFTDNSETENISTVLMYVELDNPGMVLEGCTIAGAAAGWLASTGMCFTDGPFVILTAYDPIGGISLVDGRMFTITSNMPALSINRIYFWNEGEVGYQHPNLYPDPVQLTDFNSSSVTFSAVLTPIEHAQWGAVKSLYR